MFQEFFRTHQEVQSFSWCQYTPYFNDGDACTFRVRDVYHVNMKDGTENNDKNTVKYVNAILETFDSDVLQAAFGDHVEVTVQSDGSAVVEGYEHD